MAAPSLPANQHTALETFHADAERLDKRDWRLWGIAGLIMLLMVSTIAALAIEIEYINSDFLSDVQLDVGVRGLLTMVLIFAVFVLYQQIVMYRMRQNLVRGLRGMLNEPRPDVATREETR